jgi:hypothetical protein
MFGDPDEVLAGHAGWEVEINSWLGGTVIGANIPIMAGRITADVSQNVPERLWFRVPPRSPVNGRSFSWYPGEDVEHPLAAYGQTVTAQIKVTAALNGAVWVVKLGRFSIQSWAEQDDGSIQVETTGMLQRIATNRLTSPIAPWTTGTLLSEFRRLLPPEFTVTVDPALVDRPCPQSMSWADSRIDALYEIAEAWPARLRTSTDGWRLLLLPPLPEVPDPIITLTDGERGVVIQAPDGDSRDEKFNRIVGRSTQTDDFGSPAIQAIAEQDSGPMSVYGNYGVVTKFWSSPLVDTQATAQKSVDTLLAKNLAPTREQKLRMALDPRIGLDTSIKTVMYKDQPTERNRYGWVTSYDIPLTVEDGDQSLTLGLSA